MVGKHFRREAEVAAENYYKSLGYDTRRAIKARFFKVDFFGADVMGRKGAERVYVQVTTGQKSAVTSRRRKLERDDWSPDEQVLLFQLVVTQDPVHKARDVFWFRVHEYKALRGGDRRSWIVMDEAIPVPRELFRVSLSKPPVSGIVT